MKSWRVGLLLCLMLLVPFRGAVAAAMLCPPAGTGHHAVQEADAHQHHHATAEEAAEHADTQAEDHGDRCRLCAAFCSVASIVHTAPLGVLPAGPVTMAFPDIGAPAPWFVADGQERPPRSC